MKIKTRINQVGNKYGVQIQLRPRGKWLQQVDGVDGQENPVIYDWREEAELRAWLTEKGPNYRRWFENNYEEGLTNKNAVSTYLK